MPDGPLPFVVRALRAGRSARPTLPYKLNLLVTTRCNQRCLMCRIWEKEATDLPLGDIRSLFERCGAFSWVDVSGGEIFLRPDILSVFETIVERCRSLALLHFPTNGSLPDTVAAVTREVVALRPPRLVVTVSIDGPRELHDRLRGQSGAFERAVETYRRLREIRRCRVFFGMTLSGENAGMFEETRESLRKAAPGWSPDDLHINLVGRSVHYYGNEDVKVPEPQSLAEKVRAILGKKAAILPPWRLLERRYLEGVLPYLATGRGPVRCTALRATCTVSPDGTVYPCITWDHPLGRLVEREFDLARIWNDPHTVEIAEKIHRDGCPGCWTPCEAVPSMMSRPTALFLGFRQNE